jgi:arginyl-tRNA synthetase
MILPVHAALRTALADTLTTRFSIARTDQPAIVIDVPPNRALGDLAVPVAFELARRLRQAPRLIAQQVADALGPIAGVARVEATANGYLNFFLDRPALTRQWLRGEPDASSDAVRKVIVEHTAINPNKAAHIGHLRNATLGDTLVRLLKFQGRHVEVQNYIDDTGVQVADVVVGLTTIEGRDLAGVRSLIADRAIRFDYYCWDLYARVTEWYAADKARLEVRSAALHAIEEGGNPLAEIAAIVADRIVRAHLDTMARLNVGYDLLTWEGDILRLHFWTTAFEQLKATGAIYLREEGRLKGCWVMPIGDEQEAAEPASPPINDETGESPDEDDPDQREKVIVRSNGTVTYVGKDIANQFWKFGLLGRDFHYRPFESRNGRTVWATSSSPSADGSPPAFGRASAVFNVIDTRQSYLQALLKQALGTIGFTEQAANSTHFSYEMVALSHATARALGYGDQEADGKPFVEVSGRKGLGVKADDLIDRLISSATAEVAERNPDQDASNRDRAARVIATAALRYFLVKFTRTKVIAFDIDEALSFEGETGPYLQYATVRAGNILAKLGERDGTTEDAIVRRLTELSTDPIASGDDADELWGLVLEASRLDEIAEIAVRSLELSLVAKFAFGLAQAFNAFYHRQQILKEDRIDARLWRAAAVLYTRRQLTRALDLMGCEVPARM